jgi:calcineurin-like phosphoesterase family protein
MSNVWFTADSHFGHRAMAATGKGWRPFATIEEHDETLIENWNKVVKHDDQVWHLGDVGMGSEMGILEKISRCNGSKHLIAGNHDKCWSGERDAYKHIGLWMSFFDSVQTYARRRLDGNQNIMLSHFPYAGDHTSQERYNQYRLRDDGLWLAHGHVHDAWAKSGRQVNVGVDVRDFTPMHLDELVEAFRSAEQPMKESA